MRKILAILVVLLATGLGSTAARAEDGPRELVTRYMEALKTKNYAAAASVLGFEVSPQAMSQVGPMLDKQKYFMWAVKGYRILEEKHEGGLALVTVEETQFKDLDPALRANLESVAPALVTALKFGDNVVKERFVLVKLDGRWQFDTSHSGLNAADFMKKTTEFLQAKSTNPDLNSDQFQAEAAAFINSIGFGQLVQSFAAMAPAVPVFAAILVPNFIRARAQGQATACKSNLKNIGTALEMYSTDNNGRYATSLEQLTPNYLKVIPTCPAAEKDTYSSSFQSAAPGKRGGEDAFTVICAGNNHEKAGIGPNYPQYNSREGLKQ